MDNTKNVICLVIAFICAASAFPQGFNLEITPSVDIPIGDDSREAVVNYLGLGGGVELAGVYSFPGLPFLRLSGALGYRSWPVDGGGSLVALSLAGGGGLFIEPLPILSFSLDGRGGFYYGIFSGTQVPNGFAEAGLGIRLAVSNALKLGAGVSFVSLLASPQPTYLGYGITLSGSYAFGAASSKPRMEFGALDLAAIFPVFFKWYDINPLGSISLVNHESRAVQNVRVTAYVKEFMDAPKLCATSAELKPGQAIDLPLHALFADRILTVTEATKATITITVTYELRGDPRTIELTESLRILDRNAMTWADDRRAASFVTAKDPVVLTLSKNVAGVVRDDVRSGGDLNFRIALGLYQALAAYGMSYVVDPDSSYGERSGTDDVVDFLQFPRQTLQYRSGDCDDLSILYAALLESVGIESAFVLVPGHIYVAAALSLNPAEAARTFQQSDRLIVIGEKVYVPIETTMFQRGFMAAWSEGARQWREAGDRAALIPVREAWTEYEAVGIRDAPPALILPDAREALEAYGREMDKFIATELEPQVGRLQDEMRRTQETPALLNKLALLYARYGRLAEAEEALLKIVATRDYLPAFVNLGNIAYLSREPGKAAGWFERALDIDPRNAAALSGAARSWFDAGDPGRAMTYYERLKAVDPAAANRYSYIQTGGGTERASSSSVGVEWYE